MVQGRRFFLCMVILAFPILALAQGPEAGRRPELFIQMQGERLTVQAREVPQRRLLEGLAGRLGFELIVLGPLNQPRSLEVHGERWEEVLTKALRPASWAFVYEKSGGKSRLAKVFVFPQQREVASPSSSGVTALDRPPDEAAGEEEVSPESAEDKQEQIEGWREQFFAAKDTTSKVAALQGLVTVGGTKEAAQAMLQVGGQQAVQRLQEALEGQTEQVRQAVQELLGISLKEFQSTDRP